MTAASDYYVTVHVHPHGEVHVFRWDLLLSQEEFWLTSALALVAVEDMTDEHTRDARSWLVEHADRVAETARAFWTEADARTYGVPEASDVLNSPLAEALRDEVFFRAARDFAACVVEDPEHAVDVLDLVLAPLSEMPTTVAYDPFLDLTDGEINEFVKVLAEQIFPTDSPF